MRPGVSLSFVLHLVLHCELISITSFNAQNTIEGRCRCPLVRMRTLALREHKSCPMDTVGTWGLVLTRVLLEVGFPLVTVDCVPAFPPFYNGLGGKFLYPVSQLCDSWRAASRGEKPS